MNTPAPKAIEALPELLDKIRDEIQLWTGADPTRVMIAARNVLAALAAAQAEQAKPTDPEPAWIASLPPNRIEPLERRSGKERRGPMTTERRLTCGYARRKNECDRRASKQPSPPSDRGPAGTPPPVEQGYTGYGRNMFYEGHFDGETDRDREDRLREASETDPPITPPQADRADAEMLEAIIKALGDLSFECWGIFGTVKPSHLTYNNTFEVLQKARAHIAARATQEPKL